MAETLTFTQQGSAYTATYTSTGDTVVQLVRKDSGWLNIYANIDGMEKKVIGSWSPHGGDKNMIFKVSVPSGLTVTVESESEVTEAKRQDSGG